MKNFLIFSLLFFLFGSTVAAKTNIDEDTPTLTIISPKNNDQIFDSKITVSFIVKNFIFTDPSVRNKNETGEGHLNVWLDEQNPDPGNAQKIVRATDFTLQNIDPGSHQLILELVNNDDSSLNPPIRKIISFSTIAQKEITVAADQAKTDGKEEKIKKVQQLKDISTIAITTILSISLIGAVGFIISNRVLNK